MQNTQELSVALTTAWTEVNPNYIIEYSAIYVNSGSITAEIYDNTGWIKTSTASAGETIKFIASAKKLRIKATTGVASINYYLSGNPFLIGSHTSKVSLVSDDLILIEDSADSLTKKVSISAMSNSFVPYTGASANVNIGANDFTTTQKISAGNSETGDGTNKVLISGSGEITFEGTAKRKLTLRPNLIDKLTKFNEDVPTQVYRGVNIGYSMPIWNSDNEELYFRMRIPLKWDGTTDPQFGMMVTLQSAEDAGDKFKFELSWQTNSCHGGAVMDTTESDAYTEQTIITGGGTQYTSYCVFFTLDADDADNPIVAGSMIQGRVRRVAATSSEVDGEIAIWDWVSSWAVDKVGGAWSVEENVSD